MQKIAVAIVGAGFGGLCAAIQLRVAGIDSWVILERSQDVGGTWRDNDYPGCACDVPSHLYSFSFAQNRAWSRPYPQQKEIQAYLLDLTDRYALRPKIQFGADVQALRWLDERQAWLIELRDCEPVLADHVILATGPLNKPLIPNIPGLETFKGSSFHSSQWRHDIDLTGLKIAVVGTGASAVQFVPEIAGTAATVNVFQRTPGWVLPRWDTPYGAVRRWLYRYIPGLQRVSRWRVYWFNELIGTGFMGGRWAQAFLRKLSSHHLKSQVTSLPMRDLLTPNFNPGCKRLLISNTWFPALLRTNVRLVDGAVSSVCADAVVDAQGIQHPCDVIIWGTGFKATEFVTPMKVYGKSVAGNVPELSQLWRTQPAATRHGITVAGFPNLFMLVGPSTGLGHNSIVFMIECQVHYVLQALRFVIARGGAPLQLRSDVQDSDYSRIQRKMKRTVWSSGCHSWYQNSRGEIDTLWPGYTWEYWLRTRHFSPAEYL